MLTADDVGTIVKAVAEVIIAAQRREWNSPDEAAGYLGPSHQYLAKLRAADATGLTIQVSHYPPGTSNWNRIEHRLFCNISQTWRGKSLVNRLAVVELIAATTTTTGLTVDCVPDPRRYAKGIQVSDAEMACLNIQSDEFHPEWNYTIPPRRQA